MSPRSRKSRARLLVLAWTLPLFLLGPVLNGRTFLLHAHADAGAHLHVLAEHGHEHAPHGEEAHASWFEDEHRAHEHEHHHDRPAPREHRESDCFVVCFSGPFPGGSLARLAPAERVIQAAVERVPLLRARREVGAPEAGPTPWRARAGPRSGAAARVAAGHGLLI
ncbi:MAG TPA: hypothetical protein VF530_18655 [Planctomycetota bacterium]